MLEVNKEFVDELFDKVPDCCGGCENCPKAGVLVEAPNEGIELLDPKGLDELLK